MTANHSLRVTIGIPTYNRADSYLKYALQSAVAQQYENLEIVVSDNCSTDHTEALVGGMNDKRIRYFRQSENVPANDNFNFCLAQASGDYFLLLHDDDLIDPDFVGTCMQAAEGSPDIGVIFTGTRTIDGSGNILLENEDKVTGVSFDDFLIGWLNGQIALYLCSTLYNTKALKALGGFSSPKNLFQDVVATVKLAKSKGRLDIRAIKASFRRHGDNRGSSARVIDWSIDSRYVMDLMCRSAGDKEAEVRRHATRFFCLKNYAKASTIANPLVRWKTYYYIYRKFDRNYPLYRAFKWYEIAIVKQLLRDHLPFLRNFRKAD